MRVIRNDTIGTENEIIKTIYQITTATKQLHGFTNEAWQINLSEISRAFNYELGVTNANYPSNNEKPVSEDSFFVDEVNGADLNPGIYGGWIMTKDDYVANWTPID